MKRILKAMSRALKCTAIAVLSTAVVTFLVCATRAGLCSLGMGYVLSSFLTVFIWAFILIAFFEFLTDNL